MYFALTLHKVSPCSCPCLEGQVLIRVLKGQVLVLVLGGSVLVNITVAYICVLYGLSCRPTANTEQLLNWLME